MIRRTFVVVSCLSLAWASAIAASRCLAAAFDPAPPRNRAAALLDNGDDVKAIEIFRDLVKRLPSSALDRTNLGIALLHHNDLQEAETELRKALALDTKDLRAHYNLGLVLKRNGRNEEAAAELAAVAAAPEGEKDASVHYNLGILYKRLRRSDEALASFQRAVALRPEHASAHFQIYNEMVQRGDKAKAAPELELFKLLQKATPDFQRTEAYLERGTFTRIMAPGPDVEGRTQGAPGAPEREAGTVPIRFEVRVGGGSDAAGRGSSGGAGIGSSNTSGRGSADATGHGSSDASVDSDLVGAALADFDGDGSVDLALGDSLGGVRVVRQSTPGVFAPKTSADGGAQASASSGGGASAGGKAPSPANLRTLALAAGDADNDGDLDVAASSAQGVRLFINDGKGRLADRTRGSGLEGAGGASDLRWIDTDRDGDLDVVLGGVGSEKNRKSPRLYLNASVQPATAGAQSEQGGASKAASGSADKASSSQSTLRFIAAGPEAALPECGEMVAFSDLRGRDDLDLIFLCADGALHVARNLRAGRFQTERAGGATSSIDDRGGRILAADLDGDERNDLLVLARGALSVLWGEDHGRLARSSALAQSIPPALTGVAAIDADGDGDLDVAAVAAGSPATGGPGSVSSSAGEQRTLPDKSSAGTSTAQLVLLRNDGRRRFAAASDVSPAIPGGASALLTADVDRDGDPDLLAIGPDGGFVSMLNVTKGPNRFLRVSLRGGKSNKFGVGAKVEVRAGRLVVRRESDGSPLLLGVGASGRVDAVQIVWPTGVSQDLVDVPTTPLLKVEEKREFAGSCPFLYVRDETGFRFIGEALSGAPIGFLKPDGLYESPRPIEHLRLPPGLPVAKDGRLSVRLTEEMRELTALDSARLVAVDHPVGTEVYSNERLREAQEPFRFVLIKDLTHPSAAVEVELDTPEGSAAGPGAGAGADTDALRPARSDKGDGDGQTRIDPGDSFLGGRGDARVNDWCGPQERDTDRTDAGGRPQKGVAKSIENRRSPLGQGSSATRSARLSSIQKKNQGIEIDTNRGVTALEAIRHLDDRAPDRFATLGARLEGYAVPHALVLRFDGVAHQGATEELALVLDGWVSWTTSDVSRALYQTAASEGETVRRVPDSEDAPARPMFAGRSLPSTLAPWGPALEVRVDEARADEPDLGLPVGPSMVAPLPRVDIGKRTSGGGEQEGGDTQVVDVGKRTRGVGELEGGDSQVVDIGKRTRGGAEQEGGDSQVDGAARTDEEPATAEARISPIEVRIGSNLTVYYDRIRLGRLVEAPLETHELAPVAADLRWRGVAAVRRHQDEEPARPDYHHVSPLSPFARLPEATTPVGDVLALVAEDDGRMVIFGTGEEVAIDFDATAIPPPPPGFTRTWFLVSRGYARDGDPNTKSFPWGER